MPHPQRPQFVILPKRCQASPVKSRTAPVLPAVWPKGVQKLKDLDGICRGVPTLMIACVDCAYCPTSARPSLRLCKLNNNVVLLTFLRRAFRTQADQDHSIECGCSGCSLWPRAL